MPSFNVSRDHSGDSWFRLGRFDVTTTVLLVLVGAIGLVVSAFAPGLMQVAYFDPRLVLGGEVWRAITWPFFAPIGLWTVLTLVMLWYFGRDLESQIGRSSMAWLYIGLWGMLTLVSLVVGLMLGGGLMAGLNGIQFLVLLLWIAENPRRPFFFNIPGWVVGAVLVAIQVLGLIMGRDLGGLVALLVTFVGAVLVARRFGLLSDLSWLPGRARKQRTPRPPRSAGRVERRRVSDAERMDALLEKISREGIHSLTPAERKELEALRQRRKAS